MPSLRRGCLYRVEEKYLTWPKPYPNNRRNHPVLVMTAQELLDDPGFLIVTVCPTSSAGTLADQYCVELDKYEGGATDKCWIYPTLVTTLRKTNVGEPLSLILPPIPAAKLELVGVRVAQLTGVLPLQ